MPVKTAPAMMGRIEEVYRLPLVRIMDNTRAQLQQIVTKVDLLEAMGATAHRSEKRPPLCLQQKPRICRLAGTRLKPQAAVLISDCLHHYAAAPPS
jgi:hypothetical protein